MEAQPRKLLDQVRDQIRLKHYSYRTEQTYVYWIRRYILFHQKRHPAEMGSAELEAFLTHLAVVGKKGFNTEPGAQCGGFSLPPGFEAGFGDGYQCCAS